MRQCLCVFGALAVTILLCSADFDQEWVQFEAFNVRYLKKHSNESEKMYRFKVFQESLARQDRLNKMEASLGRSAVYGVNQFSDLTQEEFKNFHLSEVSSTPMRPPTVNKGKVAVGDLPLLFDWRDKGVIGAIRNQQRCGSCWAFATVETIESTFAVETNASQLPVTLSSQQLISCDYDPPLYLFGCKGGNIGEAFQTLKTAGTTLVSESVYPFASANGETLPCKTNLPTMGLRLVDFDYADNLSEDVMRLWLTTNGPLTTSVNAISWQDYAGGIIQHHCTSLTVDHAVQIVGYDMTGDVPYWVVRNTWGPQWGENGYVRIKYGGDVCGITVNVASVTKVVSVT